MTKQAKAFNKVFLTSFSRVPRAFRLALIVQLMVNIGVKKYV